MLWKWPSPRPRSCSISCATCNWTKSVLILLPQHDEAVLRSVRNLPKVKTLVAQYLNVRDLFNYDYILIPLQSLQLIEGILG